MAALASALKDWSTTEGSNGPLGTDAPSLLDNGIRTAAAVMRARIGTRDTIASASTCDIGTKEAGTLTVTGTTGISSLGTSLGASGYGIIYELVFAGTLTITHSSSLDCIGSANITTAAGDTSRVQYSASGWTMLSYSRKSGLVAASAFTFGDGTVSAPSISFTSDANLGAYRIGADQLGITANGVLIATFGVTSVTIPTLNGTTITGANLVGSTNVRSPSIGSASGACTLYSASDTYNFDQTSGTAAKFQVDGEQIGVAGTAGSGTFTAWSIPGAVGGAEPYQFGIGSHPSSAADTGAWADVFFTALKGARIGASAAINNVLTVYSQNASVNAIYVFKDGPNPIWRVDKDGATFADGAYSGSGADYAEAFMPAEGYEPEPRQPVVLVGDRVRAATHDDDPLDIIGVTSERACAIGDAHLLEAGGVAVGLMGKLRVAAGLPVHPSWRLLGDDLYLVK